MFTSACKRSLDDLDETVAESKLIGTWKIAKVESKVKGDGKWGWDNVSSNFRNWEFEFITDNTLNVYIPDENLSLVGTWGFYEDWDDIDDGKRDEVKYLYMHVYDPEDWGVWRIMELEDLRFSENQLIGTEVIFLSDQEVSYRYTFRR